MGGHGVLAWSAASGKSFQMHQSYEAQISTVIARCASRLEDRGRGLSCTDIYV